MKNDMLFLDIAKTLSKYSTCRRRNYGAVIVKNNRIVSYGYNSAPGDLPKCNMPGMSCMREKLNCPQGSNYELCEAVHAEQMALINGDPKDFDGAVIYLYGYDRTIKKDIINPLPCKLCNRMLINSGIKQMITPDNDIEIK